MLTPHAPSLKSPESPAGHQSPGDRQASESKQAVPTSYSVALVLAGCGAKDGSEITEAVSLLVAFAQRGFNVTCFAPDRPTFHTVNHLTGMEDEQPRNILAEAARIARGKVAPLATLNPAEFDAIALAGGFGAAKNLCNFALAGKDAKNFADVKSSLDPFLQAKKPVGALCIAPVILAIAMREQGKPGLRLTLGDGSAHAAIEAIVAWGAVHVPTPVNQACIDPDFHVVTAPAYMYDSASSADVFASAQALVIGLGDLLAHQKGPQ